MTKCTCYLIGSGPSKGGRRWSVPGYRLPVICCSLPTTGHREQGFRVSEVWELGGRGWVGYFRHAEVKNIFEALDGWIRRKLRSVLWRQGKRVWGRARLLMQRGFPRDRALPIASNGHGPWWNAGASHMNEAFPQAYFDRLGLVSLLDQRRRLAAAT